MEIIISKKVNVPETIDAFMELFSPINDERTWELTPEEWTVITDIVAIVNEYYEMYGDIEDPEEDE